jgi:aspartyl-tRNA(Asn)/glutamyl-tRNA(Gln) amidotransferase subunit A
MSAESEPNDAHEGIWLARPGAVPTHGISLAVKDLFDTAELTTTYGSILFADHVPERSAEAVVRLERAGYLNVGKTNLHEFAYGVTSQNPHFGTVPNPIAPGRTAGGSSGGSAAALAAGLADAALGTDSGGSIRIPAACCGIVGFKPTYGLVPLDGCFPLAPTFDHAGPMARTVAGCTAMLKTLVPGLERHLARSRRSCLGRPLLAPRRRPDPRGRGTARCPTSRLSPSTRHRQLVYARSRRRPPRSLR